MAIKYLLSLFFVLLTLCLPAQKSPLKSGIALYEAKDYDKAFLKLTKANKRLHRMKPADQAMAVYYFNLVKMNIFKRIYRKGESSKLYNMLIEGYTGLDEVKQYDVDGKWSNDVLLYKNVYHPFVLESAGALLKEAQSYQRQNESERMQAYLESEAFARASLDFEASSLAHSILGQIEMGKNNLPFASEQLNLAVEMYQSDAQHWIDFSIGKAFLSLAQVENLTNKTGKAIKTLIWGQVFMENEWLKYMSSKEIMPPLVRARMNRQYENIQEELSQLERVYRSSAPNQLSAALDEFESALAANPGDVLSLLAYGRLMEEIDENEAIQLYEQAASRGKNAELALSKLGGLFLNKASAPRNTAKSLVVNEADSQKERSEYYLRKAYPYFQKIIEVNAKSEEALNSLLYITLKLEQKEDYRKYKAMQDKLD